VRATHDAFVASSSSPRTSASAGRAPGLAKSGAVARPIPVAAPVTIAAFPASMRVILSVSVAAAPVYTVGQPLIPDPARVDPEAQR
jgi:hypothetical protein